MGLFDSLEASPRNHADNVYDPATWFPAINISMSAITVEDLSELPERLRSLPIHKVQRMQAAVASAKSLFQYRWVLGRSYGIDKTLLISSVCNCPRFESCMFAKEVTDPSAYVCEMQEGDEGRYISTFCHVTFSCFAGDWNWKLKVNVLSQHQTS